MAVVNLSFCVLVLYQLSAAYSEDGSSESSDIGLRETWLPGNCGPSACSSETACFSNEDKTQHICLCTSNGKPPAEDSKCPRTTVPGLGAPVRVIMNKPIIKTGKDSDLHGGPKSKSPTEPEGVRCYCNTAQCVSTGYMCRSPSGGGCYSELLAPKKMHHASHGCLHHLAERQEDAVSRCQNNPKSGSVPFLSTDHSLLLCCFQDLCNHEDSPVARARLNLTSYDPEASSVATEKGSNYNGEVWFKAATIAVPVCGALILFLLVAVAVRLLKADALLHADRKLRGTYMSPLAQHPSEDVKKVWVGTSAAPLLMTPDGCLVAVERAQLVDVPSCQQFCDIQR